MQHLFCTNRHSGRVITGHHWYDKITLKGIFVKGLPKTIPSIMHHHWGSPKLSSRNDLALHADPLRTMQAIVIRTASIDNENPHNRFKPSPTSNWNEHTSLHVGLLSSDFDTPMSNNTTHLFMISPGNSMPSTFPTSTDCWILDSWPYCCVCLQWNNVTWTFQFNKIYAELAQIQTEGMEGMLVRKPISSQLSPSWNQLMNCYSGFAKRNRHPATLTTQ